MGKDTVCLLLQILQKFVICEVRVINVEKNNSWWHDTCGACETEIQKTTGSLYCDTCKSPIPVCEKRLISCSEHTILSRVLSEFVTFS